MEDVQITKNFRLSQLLHSDTATRNHIEEQFNPSLEVVDNLTHLAINILQPLRNALLEDFFVTCAYRCQKVNHAVGGVDNSQHLCGILNKAKEAAADCVYSKGNTLLAKTVLVHNIPFDQMILEGGSLEKPNWIHLSWGRGRNEILRADFSSGKVVYSLLTREQVLQIKT